MSTAVAVRNNDGSAVVGVSQARMQILRPLAAPQEILAAQEETRAFITEALVEGRDYGTFPGVDKKSLFKPGAERTALAFGLVSRFRIVEKEIDHTISVPWRKVKAKYEGPRGNRTKVGEEVTEGHSLGLYRYVVECEVLGRETGEIAGSAIASCSTLESKYIDRPRDAENTVLQMAEKRAFVAAIRTALGLSEQFTQDIEDDPERFAKKDAGVADDDAVKCPKCQGAMWDNRTKNDEREKEGKKRMPDYKCKDQKCQEVVWSAAEFAEQIANAEKVAAKDAEKPAADAPGAATEYQITKILELCDDARVPEALADATRERLKKRLAAARADEILVGLEKEIRKATPAPVPEPAAVAADGRPIDDDLPF